MRNRDYSAALAGQNRSSAEEDIISFPAAETGLSEEDLRLIDNFAELKADKRRAMLDEVRTLLAQAMPIREV